MITNDSCAFRNTIAALLTDKMSNVSRIQGSNEKALIMATCTYPNYILSGSMCNAYIKWYQITNEGEADTPPTRPGRLYSYHLRGQSYGYGNDTVTVEETRTICKIRDRTLSLEAGRHRKLDLKQGRSISLHDIHDVERVGMSKEMAHTRLYIHLSFPTIASSSSWTLACASGKHAAAIIIKLIAPLVYAILRE